MYEVILSNGDRAEAETPEALSLATRTITIEAISAGAGNLTATILLDGVVYAANLRPHAAVELAIRRTT